MPRRTPTGRGGWNNPDSGNAEPLPAPDAPQQAAPAPVARPATTTTPYAGNGGGGMATNPAGFVNWSDFLRAQAPVNTATAPTQGGVFGAAQQGGKYDLNPTGNVISGGAAKAPAPTGYNPSGGYTAGMANIDAMLSGAATSGGQDPGKAPGAAAPKAPTNPTAPILDQNIDPTTGLPVKRDQQGFSGLGAYMGRGM
jgi:hypothetical protein